MIANKSFIGEVSLGSYFGLDFTRSPTSNQSYSLALKIGINHQSRKNLYILFGAFWMPCIEYAFPRAPFIRLTIPWQHILGSLTDYAKGQKSSVNVIKCQTVLDILHNTIEITHCSTLHCRANSLQEVALNPHVTGSFSWSGAGFTQPFRKNFLHTVTCALYVQSLRFCRSLLAASP